MAASVSVAFFYILTASHAVHLVGGLAALVYVDVGALRFRLGPAKRTAIDVGAIFWHFLDGLWLYLMMVFYVWG
jgi:cytochrome c oxidase subunit 3